MMLKRGSIFKERSSDSAGPMMAELGNCSPARICVPQPAGTPADVAGELATLFEAGVCDGFVVTPAHLPRSFDAFVAGVVPELKRRGLLREVYRDATLREHLGEG